jgi:hypothetical protein
MISLTVVVNYTFQDISQNMAENRHRYIYIDR